MGIHWLKIPGDEYGYFHEKASLDPSNPLLLEAGDLTHGDGGDFGSGLHIRA